MHSSHRRNSSSLDRQNTGQYDCLIITLRVEPRWPRVIHIISNHFRPQILCIVNVIWLQFILSRNEKWSIIMRTDLACSLRFWLQILKIWLIDSTASDSILHLPWISPHILLTLSCTFLQAQNWIQHYDKHTADIYIPNQSRATDCDWFSPIWLYTD